jgi:hypothetical protein
MLLALNGSVSGVATGIEQDTRYTRGPIAQHRSFRPKSRLRPEQGPYFASGDTVNLSWDRLQDIGILSYDVYRYTPSIPEYKLLAQVESGCQHLHR